MPHVVASMLCVDLGIKGYSGSASCASVASAVALGDAYRLIAHGYMDRILYGGVDYNVSSNVITQGMEAFGALCTTYNDKPEDACMPFDKKRCGTVIGDGGAFLILESEEAALKRNAKKIYGEVAGVGQTNDATNIMQPIENGLGILAAMLQCLQNNNMHINEVSAFNCHARSTKAGDTCEALAIKALLAAGKKYPNKQDFFALSAEQIADLVNAGLPDMKD